MCINHEEINKEIFELQKEIQEKYPELMKYLTEMPDTLPVEGSVKVDSNALLKYLNSLKEMVLNYKNNHK
ncbi:hypothetical protein [Polaribacter sp. L3A8]|uniref:hypothetical protein n=1 Tax=Polaribacter sp. L3A8 TaxID=2686361 RepID=UPI00131CE9F4|nr:hypothetical protein [Polaribacter sp. L3A8]